MPDARHPNLLHLERVVDRLGELAKDVVFVGGSTTGLLLTDAAAPPVRVSIDVDVIVQVMTRGAYYRLSEQLRALGFAEDQSPEAPVCRWVAPDVVLDVMPTDPAVLGFSNQWYEPALEQAETVELPSGRSIRRVTAPYFIATKLDAFDGRGAGDYMLSHDMEDIIAVLDGRPELVSEIEQSEPGLRDYLADRFAGLLQDGRFLDALPGHLPGDAASQARVPLVLARMKKIAGVE